MKNKVFIFFGVGTLLLCLLKFSSIVPFLFHNARGSLLTQNIELIFNTLALFPLILFFSIITYKAPEKVFAAWWNFAKFAIPLVVVLSIPVSLGLFHKPGGFFNMDDLTDLVLYLIIGLFFAVGSVIQIVRGYRVK